MLMRTLHTLPYGILVATLLAALTMAAPAAGANKACDLLTASELETVLGTKVALQGSAAPGVDMCMGQAPTARVLLRLATGAGGDGSTEKSGIDIAKKMAAQVELK